MSRIWAAALVLLVCTACTTSERPHDGAPSANSLNATQGPSVELEASEWKHPSEGMMRSTAELYKLTPDMLEPVDVVRKVHPDEWEEVQQACLGEAGFPFEEKTGYTFPEEQAQTFGLAQYKCLGMYPEEDIYTAPYGEAELRRFYDYWGSTVIPCLQAHGYATNSLPSFEVFQATVGTAEEFFPLADTTSGEGAMEAGELCKTLPSADYIRGLSDTP